MTTPKTYAATTDDVSALENENARLAYDAAIESVVLLENDGVLPMNRGRVALYGNGVTTTLKGGTGSGEVNERYSVSFLEGMEKVGFTVTNQSWLSDYQLLYEQKKQEFEEMMGKKVRQALFGMRFSALAEMFGQNFAHPYGRPITADDVQESACDTSFYVLSRQWGEGADRHPDDASFNLAAEELEHIRFLAKHYRKTIVIINSGACLNISPLFEIKGLNALIYMGMLGCAGGLALADIIAGKNTPSGHLAATWMKNYDDVPYGRTYGQLGGNPREADYKEGIYVGYRYYDTYNVTPRYEFGYGMSYTSFMFQCMSATAEKTTVSMRVSVTNTGTEYVGREAVQAYACSPKKALCAYQQLVAFGKTDVLPPQTSAELELSFDMKDLARYDEESHCYVLDAGEYVIRIGNSSRNTTPYIAVAIADDIVISRHLPLQRQREPITEIAPPAGRETSNYSISRSKSVFMKDDKREPIFHLSIKTAAFACADYTVHMEDTYQKTDHTTDKDERITNVLAALTLSDCVNIVVGDGMDFFGREHDFHCPGAAGYTTAKLVDKGLTNIALCDGPAGLRLSPVGALRPNKIKPLAPPLAMLNHLPKFARKILLGNEKKDQLVYQYATAFPAAHTLAQSWNVGLMEEVGAAIGQEMTQYGVTYWLAPGLNIHRNPLCGRNFEYYSEDPLLSGQMAAAVTRGVESSPGSFVTLKHFCCNNQEAERLHSSSNLSERALREIYLRGFEIAVRAAGPGGVMSSYNKLNGIYTANHYDLLTRLLRHEWGFDGLVMSDWLATAKGAANPALCLAAGNDLIMPGTKRDKKAILKALKKGRLSEDDLRQSAARVVRAVMRARP
jgi:beta-glucosidase